MAIHHQLGIVCLSDIVADVICEWDICQENLNTDNHNTNTTQQQHQHNSTTTPTQLNNTNTTEQHHHQLNSTSNSTTNLTPVKPQTPLNPTSTSTINGTNLLTPHSMECSKRKNSGSSPSLPHITDRAWVWVWRRTSGSTNLTGKQRTKQHLEDDRWSPTRSPEQTSV